MRTKYAKPKKSNNTSCCCLNNHWHDSIGEADYCNQLSLLVKAKEIKEYKSQETFPLKVNGKTVCSHRVDFLVTNNYGEQEVHEYKGGRITETAVWNIKRKLFEVLYPEIEYIVVRATKPFFYNKKKR